MRKYIHKKLNFLVLFRRNSYLYNMNHLNAIEVFVISHILYFRNKDTNIFLYYALYHQKYNNNLRQKWYCITGNCHENSEFRCHFTGIFSNELVLGWKNSQFLVFC